MNKLTVFIKTWYKISNFPLKCPTVWSPCLKNYVFFTALLQNYSFHENIENLVFKENY